MKIIPVILSGGSGTRLWPLSRPETPKQFLPLVTDQSLLQDTVERLRSLPGEVGPPIVVCNEAHRFLVAEQMRELGVNPDAIVLEPEGRNTAPAVAVAALLARRLGGENSVLLVLPADHVILDLQAFAAAAGRAVEAATAGWLTTFGVLPTHPETGYGYLLKGSDEQSWTVLERFVEKPDRPTAESYLKSGRYLWNSGMFVFAVEAVLAELGRHAAGVLSVAEQALAGATTDEDFIRLGSEFLTSESISIDYALMERTDRAAVVSLDAGWNDVGSWAALYELGQADADGNVSRGDVVLDGTRNAYVLSSARTVAVQGLDGVLVVETPDAVMIGRVDSAQDVKRLAEIAGRRGRRSP